MITRISSGGSPGGAVFYNEQKVGKGEAQRLAVRNFEGIRLSSEQLTPAMVAGKLEDRASLSERVKLPTFHVSLALAKGEVVPPEDLLAIADQYMLGMGYGRQPYAVYQHHDTEHPHIHIVSVRVDETGKKISDKFEREKSNTLRQQIEKDFGLQIAEQAALRPQRAELRPVHYGEGDLKRDISNVVQGILKDFRFSTFAQYNQLLKIFNVQAVEVTLEGGKRGLKYSAIDKEGKPVGPAMKASSLPYRPTWETVERRMNAGKKIKGDQVASLRRLVGLRLDESRSWGDFHRKLQRLGMAILPHQGAYGNLFGVSFLDTKRRTIYTGSELGKDYTANNLKIALGEPYEPRPTKDTASQEIAPNAPNLAQKKAESNQETTIPTHNGLIWEMLRALNAEENSQSSEQDLKRMLKKSRQKPRLS
ncbi:conjugal transfer protein MobB [Nibrella viscosa]|uniref:Conjugal transfer protein MobB n=1 Tax=Nibrella viscosa TaxID=1084524 RepID=A0ABP8KZF7_9BACT